MSVTEQMIRDTMLNRFMEIFDYTFKRKLIDAFGVHFSDDRFRLQKILALTVTKGDAKKCLVTATLDYSDLQDHAVKDHEAIEQVSSIFAQAVIDQLFSHPDAYDDASDKPKAIKETKKLESPKE